MTNLANGTLRDLGEDAVVARILARLPKAQDVTLGAGDDCAEVTIGGHTNLLLKADAIVEGVHYLAEEKPQRVGAKAIKRPISDIASMGGTPLHALVTSAFPPETPIRYLEQLYDGLVGAATRYGVAVVGGETVSLPAGTPAVLSVSLTGTVEGRPSITRAGARPGDAVFVTGVLGGSLESGWHLDFQPRLAEGQWLREQGIATAMMDLSDGLGLDLKRMADASQCSFQIDQSLLPVRESCTPQQAIEDGEDYELLFTCPQEKTETLVASWPFQTKLTPIGKTTPAGETNNLPTDGWQHFKP